MPTELHVAVTGSDTADGSAAAPLRTINRAAQLAQPGDTVTVHAGEYREWVRPARGGLSDRRRITYRAAPGEHVIVKGSERVTAWTHEEGDVWRTVVPNSLFGEFNPFAVEVAGDWIVRPKPGGDVPARHLGDVYLDGRSFYEVSTRAELVDPPRRTEVVDDWTGTTVPVVDPDQTQYVWHATVGEHSTTIHANFQGADPNERLVEINVRRSVFSPTEHHLDWITVRGFELAQAATPWAPPTADQPGLIGPNWARGWIIEDNVVHDSKCSGISLGKEASTGDNYATLRGDKPGYQYQLESVFAARQIGWDREHVGSHVVRRNRIYDCGQTGIVGHLGCVFSTIEDNHISRIAIKREFYGHEIAGIKLHAPLDVRIEHNRIQDCSLGIWLDWQTQGTRVTRNVLYGNSRDLFVEVSHGPYVVDHNVLASPVAFESFSQGGAIAHNLIAGTVRLEPVMDRATPYHRPHSTQVSGYATIFGADDRWVGNLFVRGDRQPYAPGHEPANFGHGTAGYDGHPASWDEYAAIVSSREGDHARFLGVKQAVYVHDNVYVGGAAAFVGETRARVLGHGSVAVVDEGGEVFVDVELPDGFDDVRLAPVSGADLPRVRLVDADFEEPDGTPVRLTTDLVGATKERDGRYAAGPVADLRGGRRRVW
jgi:hypothetical protein